MRFLSKISIGIAFLSSVWLLMPTLVKAQQPEALLPVANEVVLFDGKNLDQWICLCGDDSVKMDDVWTIKDGVIACAGKPTGYLQTKRWFKDYQLELQWRWPGKSGGNSGVLIHTTTPLLFFGWPKSLEVQLQSGSAGDFWVIGEGVDVRVENEEERRAKPREGDQHSHRRIRRLVGDFEKPVNQWNDMKVVCQGDDIKVFVNGILVNHGTKCSVVEGAIALQSEGTPVEFRNIKLRPIDQ